MSTYETAVRRQLARDSKAPSYGDRVRALSREMHADLAEPEPKWVSPNTIHGPLTCPADCDCRGFA